MTNSNQKWDYATMQECSGELKSLQARAVANRELMTSEFQKVIGAMDGSQAALGLLSAYESQTATLDMFPQIINSLDETLNTCIDTMQEIDASMLASINSMFKL